MLGTGTEQDGIKFIFHFKGTEKFNIVEITQPRNEEDTLNKRSV